MGSGRLSAAAFSSASRWSPKNNTSILDEGLLSLQKLPPVDSWLSGSIHRNSSPSQRDAATRITLRRMDPVPENDVVDWSDTSQRSSLTFMTSLAVAGLGDSSTTSSAATTRVPILLMLMAPPFLGLPSIVWWLQKTDPRREVTREMSRIETSGPTTSVPRDERS